MLLSKYSAYYSIKNTYIHKYVCYICTTYHSNCSDVNSLVFIVLSFKVKTWTLILRKNIYADNLQYTADNVRIHETRNTFPGT